MNTKEFVVCFPINGIVYVWLAKKNAEVGAGRLNGYGGKIKPGETSLDAAMRELREESGLNLPSERFDRVGVLRMTNTKDSGEKVRFIIHVFLATVYRDERPRKVSDEMEEPAIYYAPQAPFEAMMPIDRHWFPLVFMGRKRKFMIDAEYTAHQQELVGEPIVEIVERLPD